MFNYGVNGVSEIATICYSTFKYILWFRQMSSNLNVFFKREKILSSIHLEKYVWSRCGHPHDIDGNVINYNTVLLLNNYIIHGVLCKFASIKPVYQQ